MAASLRISGSIITLCLLECIAAPANAQETAGPDPSNQAESPQTSQGLQEILIVAQKRSENLQEVPITVSTASAETLERSGINDSRSLGQIVPGMVNHRIASANFVILRGIGASVGSLSDENSVATYVDGVYVSSFQGAYYALNNIERIEVLRGPQGTLFGRNATGGVVQVITRDPQYSPSLDVSLGYGTYDTADVRLYGTTGIAPNLATDLAVYYRNQHDGFGRNLFDGRDNHREELFNIRNRWRLEIGDRTDLNLSLEYGRNENDSTHENRAFPGGFLAGGSTYPGFYNVDVDAYFPSISEQRATALTLRHDLEWAEFVSISSWRRTNTHETADQDSTRYNVFTGYIASEIETLTQEFQINSREGSPFTWTAGFYYIHSNTDTNFVGTGAGATPPLPLLPPPAPPIVPTYQRVVSDQSLSSYAAFAQATAPLTTNTNVTAGLRYTRDERKIENAAFFAVDFGLGPTEIPVLGPFEQEANFDELTYRFSLDHQLSPDVMLYAVYSRGFKGGLFNDFAPGEPAVRPETLDAYEVGIKSEWLDRRLRVNAAGFYYDYSDIQLLDIVNGFPTTRNAAAAESWGLELDFEAVPAQNLTLRGGVSYLHAEFSDYRDASVLVPNPFFDPTLPFDPSNPATWFVNVPLEGQNVTGNRLPWAPKWQANLGATYDIPTAQGGWSLGLFYTYNDGYFSEAGNNLPVPSYSLVNASINWTSPSGNWSVGMWANNLLDEEYIVRTGATTWGYLAVPGSPLTLGLNVRFRWQ